MNNSHPLADDPSTLTDEQLETRITELNRRWHTARRMNWNQGMLNQLDLMLQGLEYERLRRSQQPETGGQVLDSDWTGPAKDGRS